MTELTIMLIVWAVIFTLALMAELLTEALVSVWFCVGAIVAFAITFIPGMPYWGEIIVFVGVSLITFLVLRPILQKETCSSPFKDKCRYYDRKKRNRSKKNNFSRKR